MRSRPFRAASLLAGALLGISGCGSSTGSSTSGHQTSGGNTVHVGLLANLTGGAAPSFGVPFKNGFELALSDARETLQESGISIDTMTEDAKSAVPSAVTGYNKLKSKNVSIVVNDSQSPLGQAIAPLANDDHIAFLSGAGSKLENKEGYAFRFTDLSTPTQGMGKYLVDSGARRIGAVVASDNPSFASLADATEGGVPGGYVSRQQVASSDADFSAVLANLRKDNVDAVVLSVLPAQAGNILLQMQNAGGFDNVRKVGTVAISSEAYTVAGSAAKGFVFPQVWAPNGQSSKKFQNAYTAAYGQPPTAYGALGYQVAWTIVAAAIQASRNGGVTGTSLRDALPGASTGTVVAESGILPLALDKDGKATSAGVMAEFAPDGTIVELSGKG